MRFVKALVLTGSFLLAACATTPVALSPQLQQNLDAIQVVLFSRQTNLEIEVTPGNPGGTGLLGALIVAAVDEARRQKAAQTAAGVVDATRSFDFNSRMAAQLGAELQRTPAIRLHGPIVVEPVDSDSQRRIVYDTSRAPAVLMAGLSYKLIDAKLAVQASVVMYPKSAKLMAFRPKPVSGNPLDDGNAIYRRVFTFTSDQIAPAQVRESLNQGLANVAWQIAADMRHVAGSSDAVRTTALAPLSPTGARGSATGEGVPAVLPLPSKAVANASLQGTWAGSYQCGPYLGPQQARVANRNGWTVPAQLTVQGVQATLARGDASYREVLSGDIDAGLSVQLNGQGKMTESSAAPWTTRALGHFVMASAQQPARFQGTASLSSNGVPLRECTFEFAKAAAG